MIFAKSYIQAVIIARIYISMSEVMHTNRIMRKTFILIVTYLDIFSLSTSILNSWLHIITHDYTWSVMMLLSMLQEITKDRQ